MPKMKSSSKCQSVPHRHATACVRCEEYLSAQLTRLLFLAVQSHTAPAHPPPLPPLTRCQAMLRSVLSDSCKVCFAFHICELVCSAACPAPLQVRQSVLSANCHLTGQDPPFSLIPSCCQPNMANRIADKQNKCVNVKEQRNSHKKVNKKRGNGQQIKTRQNKNKI